jgi:tetratricopeptide (TPR) repeat protein
LYYFSKGEYTLAIDDLTKAIEIAFSLEMYDRYNLNVFRGEACRRVQRYEEAVKEFTFVISKAPRPVYFYHRGLAFKALGRIKEANEDFIQSGTETGPLDWY